MVVASLAVGLLSSVLFPGDGAMMSSTLGSCAEIVDNVRTACGYRLLFVSAAQMAGLGALTGASFWFIYSNPKSFSFLLIFAIFIAIGAGLVGVNYATEDRTCHSSYMRGRTSISPTLSINLDITPSEWDLLPPVMREFSKANNLMFWDYIRLDDPAFLFLQISVCKEGVNFEVVESHTLDTKIPQHPVDIAVLVTNESVDYRPLANDLVARLRRKWPDRVSIREKQGGAASPPRNP